MSTVVHLSGTLADRLAAEAARRGVSVDELSAELLAAGLAEPGTPKGPGRRRLAFAGVGASGSAQGGAQADELLSEGFGRS